MEEEKYMIVKMLQTYGNNVKGEPCGFPLSKANRLITAGTCRVANKADLEEYYKQTEKPKKRTIIEIK